MRDDGWLFDAVFRGYIRGITYTILIALIFTI